MPVVRRFSYLCCALAAVVIIGGCSTVKSVGHGVASLWTDDDADKAAQTSDEMAVDAPLADEAPAQAAPLEAAPTEAAPEPEPTPEPVVETTPEPTPEPTPAPVVETAPPLPPGGPVVFEDEQPTAAPPPPAEPETYEVIVPEGTYAFVPRQLTVYEGDTVIWKNTSGLVHLFATIPGSDASGAMEIEPTDLLVGTQVQHVFQTAGTFPYFCFIHNRMTGKVVVLPR